MTQEQLKDNELNNLMRNAMLSDVNLLVPQGLSGKVIRKLERKILIRELMFELAVKALIIAGSLALLAGILVWLDKGNMITGLVSLFSTQKQLILSLLLLSLMVILIDQVGLKYYTGIRREAGLNS